MNTFLLFLIKSTLSISLLYLAFQILMRKEAAFRLNRMILIFSVVISVSIPFLHLPQPVQPVSQFKLEPIFQSIAFSEELMPSNFSPELTQPSVSIPKTDQPISVSFKSVLLYIYLSGILISILMLMYSIGSVFMLFRKARKIKLEGIRLMIVTDDIPAFSFGRCILISQHDFDTNSEAIITHEQSHIRLGHFYDLMLMELVKIIFWFNPLVYRMVSDLKEIHEFQADNYTLNKGIDATQYQLLIIQKGVGSKRFALANSFNHCQIKKRIIMMNKSKTSKAWRWKVATFLPLLALLLMAFGKTGENAPAPVSNLSVVQEDQNNQSNQLSERKRDGKSVDRQLISGNKLSTTLENAEKSNSLGDISIPENHEIAINDQSQVSNITTSSTFSKEPASDLLKEMGTSAISGKVVNNENGKPIPGATVMIKDKTIGTITNSEGKFELKEVNANSSLIFIMDGFERKEVEVNNNGEIIVNLVPNTNLNAISESKRIKEELWKRILEKEGISKFPEGKEPVVIQDGVETLYDANSLSNLFNPETIKSLKYSKTPDLKLKQASKAENGVLQIETTLSKNMKQERLWIVDGKEVKLFNQTIDVFVYPDEIKSLHSLPKDEAIKKYGKKGKYGATEVITIKE